MRRWKMAALVVVVLAIAVGAVAWWPSESGDAPVGPDGSARLEPVAPSAVDTKPVVIATSGAVEAARTFDSLVVAAEKVEAAPVMPIPNSHSAGATAVAAVDERPSDQAATVEAGAEKVAIMATGSVIGETDPCG